MMHNNKEVAYGMCTAGTSPIFLLLANGVVSYALAKFYAALRSPASHQVALLSDCVIFLHNLQNATFVLQRID